MVHEYKKPYRVGEGNLSNNHRRRRDYVISARKRSGRSQDVNLQVVWSWRYAQCYRRCLNWFHIILVINMQFRVLNTAASASHYRLNDLMNSCFCPELLVFKYDHFSGLWMISHLWPSDIYSNEAIWEVWMWNVCLVELQTTSKSPL